MNEEWFWSTVVLGGLEVLLVVSASCHAIMWRREPRGAALWIMISLMVPLAGPLLYFLMGINRTRRRARRKMQWSHRAAGPCTLAELWPRAGHLEGLAKLGDKIAIEPLVGGNAIEPLVNGEEAYPAMFAAVEKAEKSITCCSYIFDVDKIGSRFLDALMAAGKRGVQVKLLVDAVGVMWYYSRFQIRRKGLRIESFSPIGLVPTRLANLNLRNHRKLLVVDGQVAFVGGMNISERHMVTSGKKGICRDLQFRIRGQAVAQVQRAFADDWVFATGEKLGGEAFYPHLAEEGPGLARAVMSGPDADLERIFWLIVGACQAAEKSIRIVTPYFIPDHALRAAIMAAAMRGVDVRLVLPEQSDNPLVDWSTTAYLWEFLERGVTVTKTPPPFDHSKLLVVDELYVMFGSANIDPRSLRLNFELNVEAYDPEFAKRMAAHADKLTAEGRKVTLAEVDGRPWWKRLRDGAVKLFSPYL